MNSPPVRHKESVLRPQASMTVSSAYDQAGEAVAIGLNAVIFALRTDEPVVAVVPAMHGEHPGDGSLPYGRFSPREHGTLEDGLRSCVHTQTGLEPGYTQQLCTFSKPAGPSENPHSSPLVISVCYLSLAGPVHEDSGERATWRSWYAYLPWEDWRKGRPEYLTRVVEPRLRNWAKPTSVHCGSQEPVDRWQHVCVAFGLEGASWEEEKVVERYDLLCEAGLFSASGDGIGPLPTAPRRLPRLKHTVIGDQVRVLATAMAELRRAIKYRPVVFELMGEVFTLFELQKTVEAILGPHLHKQNFRRLVEGGGLVEPTGEFRFRTGGRPAQLYRFRREVLFERGAPGVRVRPGRA